MGHVNAGQSGPGNSSHGPTFTGNGQRSIDQVRSILGKLDRNIDAARSRRLHDHLPAHSPNTTVPMGGAGGVQPQSPVPAHAAQTSNANAGLNAIIGAGKPGGTTATPQPAQTPAAAAKPAQAAGGMTTPLPPPATRSNFGRATPMRIARPNQGPMTGT